MSDAREKCLGADGQMIMIMKFGEMWERREECGRGSFLEREVYQYRGTLPIRKSPPP